MEGTKQEPGCSSYAGLGVIFMLALFGMFTLGQLGEAEASYRREYREHVPMVQWAAFINEMRLRKPDLSLEEIIKMPVPFPIPSGVTCRVLAQEERVENLESCHFIVECFQPRPFTVLSNGRTIDGFVGRGPEHKVEGASANSPRSTGPSSPNTNR